TLRAGTRAVGGGGLGGWPGASAPRESPQAAAPEVGNDLAGRVVSWSASDATARMRSGPTHVQARDRATVVAVPQHGPRGEHLVELQRPVKNISADEPERALQVQRTEDLAAEHRGFEIRRVGR